MRSAARAPRGFHAGLRGQARGSAHARGLRTGAAGGEQRHQAAQQDPRREQRRSRRRALRREPHRQARVRRVDPRQRVQARRQMPRGARQARARDEDLPGEGAGCRERTDTNRRAPLRRRRRPSHDERRPKRLQTRGDPRPPRRAIPTPAGRLRPGGVQAGAFGTVPPDSMPPRVRGDSNRQRRRLLFGGGRFDDGRFDDGLFHPPRPRRRGRDRGVRRRRRRHVTRVRHGPKVVHGELPRVRVGGGGGGGGRPRVRPVIQGVVRRRVVQTSGVWGREASRECEASAPRTRMRSVGAANGT
mmetsp:Transcript_1847/g.6987  ORF Transcript_1847/g.6987 Transcript_1847/m.6987 type:complete len:301 (-) Transcript_1847:1428-2330(-)